MSESDDAQILVLNTGSSSIKFALFSASLNAQTGRRLLSGSLGGIGQKKSELSITPADGQCASTNVSAPDHPAAIRELLELLRGRHRLERPTAVGHRIVHGGPHHFDPQLIGPPLLDDLREIIDFAPEHLPQAIALIEAVSARFPSVPQIACFDTAFHRDLPIVCAAPCRCRES